jgi:hypothetical protein
MAYEADVAVFLRKRLQVATLIDDSPELSFLEGAGFRLELIRVVNDVDNKTVNAVDATVLLGDLYQRVRSAIAAASPTGPR